MEERRPPKLFTRNRLITAFVLILIGGTCYWWLHYKPLSAQERPFVGHWKFRNIFEFELKSNRQFLCPQENISGTWAMENGQFHLKYRMYSDTRGLNRWLSPKSLRSEYDEITWDYEVLNHGNSLKLTMPQARNPNTAYMNRMTPVE